MLSGHRLLFTTQFSQIRYPLRSTLTGPQSERQSTCKFELISSLAARSCSPSPLHQTPQSSSILDAIISSSLANEGGTKLYESGVDSYNFQTYTLHRSFMHNSLARLDTINSNDLSIVNLSSCYDRRQLIFKHINRLR